MIEPNKLWEDICTRFGEQSKCKTRQVGCIIVKDNHLIGQGWNGAPMGSSCDDCRRPRCLGIDVPSGKDLDRAICAHAEANAIGYCARFGISTLNSTIYIKCLCCSECAKLLVASGIQKVVYYEDYSTEDIDLTLSILYNAKIVVIKGEESDV